MNLKKDYWYPTAFSHWGEEERAAIARVVASNRFTMGPEVEAFEEELAAFNQRKHAAMVNSGSSANLIAVAALADVLRETVSVPALAWSTTYAPLVQHGVADLQLRDCDDTWCSNVFPDSRKIIGFVVGCSILGIPAARDLLDGCHLNDDCEAFGATIDGKPTASFGTIATQSFFWSHQLSAIEGGACLTDDDELARAMRMLRDHGMTRSVQRAPSFEAEYDFRLFGYNVRPLEMHAAVAREQLLKAHSHKAARRRNWAAFAAATQGLPIRMPPLGDGASPFSLHFECETPALRSTLVAALRSAGVDCRLPTGGSFRLHEYGRPWADQQTPRADKIHRTGMFLGNAPYDTPDQIARIADVMREAAESWHR